ncbi:hypothetical protein [Brenneria nigrifluens]|nr:hypothetical protein [Brenneria nigrifluens]
MKITKKQVNKYACSDGGEWFAERFPQGGEYGDIIQALNADKRYEWARWGASQAYSLFLLGKATTEFIKAETATTDAMIDELNGLEFPPDQVDVSSDAGEDGARIGSSGYDARIGSSGNGAQIGSSGYGARIGSSGNDAQIGSSGNDARIGSSGYGARIGSSGNDAQIGSSGNDAQIGSSGYGARIGSSGYGARIGSSGYGARIGSSGYGARIGSSGYGARIEATGEKPIIAAAGSVSRLALGEGGCAAVPYSDGERTRFAIAYVGENGIKAGVAYCVNDNGQFIEVKE